MINNKRWAAVVLLLAAMGFSSVSNAALVSRLGGLAYYDTEADLTWLADANSLAGSLIVDGVGGWRLPNTNPIDGTTADDSTNS